MDEIYYSLENGNHVFRKKRYSVEEELFYNKEYFARIGFPDVEITVDTVTDGGYYNPNKVTFPFRQFVFLVQGVNNTKPTFFSKAESSSKNGFIEQLGKYNSRAYDYIKNQLNQFSDILTKQPQPKTTPITDNNIPNKELVIETPQKEEVVTKPVTKQEIEYWIVKIPVIQNETIEPKGKCEMEEVKLMQTILQRKAERLIPVSIEYEYKTIGERVIMLCKRIKDKKEPLNDIEFGSCELEGSVMRKYIIKNQ